MQKPNCLWLVCQRVLPHAGTFAARDVDAGEAGELIHRYDQQHAIVNQVTFLDTRDVLEHLAGVKLSGIRTADRKPIDLRPGDAMLCITRRPDVARKTPASVRTLEFLFVERTE